jgi:hypothetical protein
MNDFMKSTLKWMLRSSVWAFSGYLMSCSFSQINSFSAEMLFTVGALLFIGAFRI